MIDISVHYAEPHHHWWRPLSLETGATVGDALRVSGFLAAFPHWSIEHGVGIDGKLVPLDTPLAGGERVEAYRPLTFDPMVSRRRRAAHRARQVADAAAPRRRRSSVAGRDRA